MSLDLSAILKARCPHCQDGALFTGLLAVNETCPNCGQRLEQYETADGPIFLVITFMGFLVCALAVWVELAYQPAFWIHAAVWGPFILISCPLLLRWTKAAIIHYHYYLQQQGQL